MAEERKNLRVMVGKLKKGEVALRGHGWSKAITLSPGLLDKAAAAPAITSLATVLLARLVKDAEDEVGAQANSQLSPSVLKRGGRVIGVEVTGLKFKVLYAATLKGKLPRGYSKTKVK